jgi:hypothetical protein
MNLTLDQYDTIYMSLRRATAISRLISECSEGREMMEIPADTICAATSLVLELLGTVKKTLLEVQSSPEQAALL